MGKSKNGRDVWRPERVAIIGLGRFGRSTALTLNDLGYEVTVVHDACVCCGTCEMMCPTEPASIVIDTAMTLAAGEA